MNKEKTTWLYGHHNKLGWGAIEIDKATFQTLDYDPEFETRRDVRILFRRWLTILSLPNMSLVKYCKMVYRGVKLYKRLDK